MNPARRRAAWIPCLFGALLASATGIAGKEDKPAARWPFFVFDNGLTDVRSPAEQAALLGKLGYDGICIRPATATPELFEAMDRHGVDIRASYIVLPAQENAKVPAAIADHISRLKGRDTILWLALTNPQADDEAAVQVIRQVCDLAGAAGLQVALYPHTGFCTNTVRTCAKLAKLAQRENLGLSFTLCHFLFQNDAGDLEDTIRSAGPLLKLVQINGADMAPPGTAKWDRLIQPLGQGTFDVKRVIHCLEAIGYRGPVNLQCYQIKQPAREHLAASIGAWNNLQPGAARK